MYIYNYKSNKYMSKQYKDYIDKLCKDADNGDIKAAKELLNEADKWSAKTKQIKEERDNNNK